MEGNGKSSGRRGEGRRKESELGKRGTGERRMSGKRKEEGFQSSCLERKEIGSGRVIVFILHCVLYHVHFILYNSLPSYPLLLLSSKRNKPLLFFYRFISISSFTHFHFNTNYLLQTSPKHNHSIQLYLAHSLSSPRSPDSQAIDFFLHLIFLFCPFQ